LKLCGLPLSPFGLRSREAFQRAIAHGLSVSEWKPGGPADVDLTRLWEHVQSSMPAQRQAYEHPGLTARAV
jgi:chromosome partitioning protein